MQYLQQVLFNQLKCTAAVNCVYISKIHAFILV
jgi:hypothetical protein